MARQLTALVSLVLLLFCYKTEAAPGLEVPDWAKDAIWYQIFPERFRNGDFNNDPRAADIDSPALTHWKIKDWGSDWYELDSWERRLGGFYNAFSARRYGGDLQGVIEKLDYLKELGINAIYLNPVFRSPSLHKYDWSSLHHVDETLGPDPVGDRELLRIAGETENPSTWVWTSADRLLLKLIEEAHKRGIRVILDGVFNHSGRGFFAFQDLLANRSHSRFADWYQITRWDDSLPDGFDYQAWFGIPSLPQFRRDDRTLNSNYKKYVFDITHRWLSPNGDTQAGIDGWRLDVAYCLPHGFWQEWRKWVKSLKPDAYITGEVVEIAPTYLQGNEFDALMNYPFAYAVTEFFVDRRNRISTTEFVNRLESLRKAYPAEITSVMQNLMSSHDTPRLASIIRNPDLNYRNFGDFFQKSQVQNNSAYRIDRGREAERNIHKMVALFQMTYVGAPMIYYGDEVRMAGANDPDSRKPMLWTDLNYQDEIAHPLSGKTRPREQNTPDSNLLRYYQSVIILRNRHPALRRGEFKVLIADNDSGLLAFSRTSPGDDLIVVFNNSDQEQTAELRSKGGLKKRFAVQARSGCVIGSELPQLECH
ncbi:MAG: hypothetical protein A2428_06810 [Bdellovibrionales bacterium RIFOXYC1_FULL_54_43]|nr:MAG: hypothetical protein A2428_06810 [Bdellovibrionales bacterium RIFOXYC1_FULL_54_43]OFZ80018.1 MAG: hypothetical protein A2603_02280 [Bdellovibrionales bacterium RIFOXYD1_FULL_55_31]